MSEPLAPIATPVYVAPAPKAKRRWPWIVGGTVAVLFVIGIATSHGSHSAAPEMPHGVLASGELDGLHDVTIAQCTPSGLAGMAQVTTKVTNHTTTVQSYMITVSLNDPAGNRVSEANGATNSLAPGQTASVDLIGSTATGAVSCTVASVSRLPV